MGNTWKITLATVVIFAAGAVTGGLLVNHVQRGKAQARAERTAAQQQQRLGTWQPAPREVLQRPASDLRPMFEQQRADFVLKVHRELQLTPEQREKIEKVVREGQERTKDFWEKNQPELRRMVQETREKIRQELSPDQRTKFEELLRQQRPANNAERPQTPRRMTPGETPPRPNRPLTGTPPTEPKSAPPVR
jgi:hypothetical protein